MSSPSRSRAARAAGAAPWALCALAITACAIPGLPFTGGAAPPAAPVATTATKTTTSGESHTVNGKPLGEPAVARTSPSPRKAFGATCVSSDECASEQCLVKSARRGQFGYCTATCQTYMDCGQLSKTPAYNWECTSADNSLQKVCQPAGR